MTLLLPEQYLLFILWRIKSSFRSMVCRTFTPLLVFIFILGLTFPTKVSSQPITIVVNSTGDGPDVNGGLGACDDGTGKCTLRAAIQTHNNNAGQNVTNKIVFNVPLPAVINIAGQPLPRISGQLNIDGTSQPGYASNGGKPIIELDGTNAGAGADGLRFVGDCIVQGLCIHSFDGEGIEISATGGVAENNVVKNNFIGTDPTGTMDKGNASGGILLSASFAVRNNEIADNLISGNGDEINNQQGPGIEIDQLDDPNAFPKQDASRNKITDNRIGIDFSGNGTTAIPNFPAGIVIKNGANNNNIAQNIISGNAQNGVLITGNGSDTNRVESNIIGADRVRSIVLPNGGNGIAITGSARRNEIVNNNIEGNTGHGILISGFQTDNNVVLNNFIGSARLPNSMNGIQVAERAQNNLISQNNIGNNTLNGITITGALTQVNIVTGNGITGNGRSGVAIEDGAILNFIGGSIAAARNFIQGNLEPGVVIRGAFNNIITNNSIRLNNFAGVAVVEGTGNAISSNSIFDNIAVVIPGLLPNGLGIDLGASTAVAGDNSVTANDDTDPDTGPNNLQNFPVLTRFTASGGNTIVQGILNSIPNTTFRLEFFSNAACDPTTFGEGETLLDSLKVTTDPVTGIVNFSVTLPGITNGSFITATATDPNNNTSEFSKCLQITGAPQPVADLELTKQADKTSLNVGDQVTFTIKLTNKGPDAATNVAVKDAAPTGITFGQVTPSAGNYNANTGVWTINTLNSSDVATLTIVSTVTQPGNITNTAEVTASDQPDPDSSPGNGIATEDDQSSVTLNAQQIALADLELTKIANKISLTVGETVTYTVRLMNKGPEAATGIGITDKAPTGMSFSQVTTSTGTYDNNTGIWSISSLSSGSQAVLTIIAATTQAGTIINTAEVTASDQKDPDSSPANGAVGEDDQSSVSVQVIDVVTVVAQIKQLINQVANLVQQGELSVRQGRILKGLLNLTLELHKRGFTGASIFTMRTFILSVRVLVGTHQLSGKEGQKLIVAAQKIIQLLEAELRHIQNSGNNPITLKKNSMEDKPAIFSLHQNYPNPLYVSTVIPFELAKESKTQITVYNAGGRMITQLLDKVMPAGKHSITWQPKNLSAGVYILWFRAGNYIKTQRMVIIK